METRRTELPDPELSAYTEVQIRFASEAWPLRAAEELRSALVFRALTRAARQAAFPEPWPGRFAAAVHDEIFHARLCADVGARLHARRPDYDARAVRARLARLGAPWRRAISLLLVEVAIGETISTCLFRAGVQSTVEPLTRFALRAIVRDEARHLRLGWTAMAALWPTLSEAQREAARAEAAWGLGVCEEQIALPAMQWLKAGRPFDPTYSALGVLHPEVRVEAFYGAVERLVLPRLSRLGIPGEAAWAGRYRKALAPSASS